MNDAGQPSGEARMRRALRISLVGLVIVGVVLAALLWQFRTTVPEAIDETGRPLGPELPRQPAAAVPAIPFTDVSREAGIDFVHETGAYGERLLPETMGGGVAFFDYDNDGDQDVFLVNSARWPFEDQARPKIQAGEAGGASARPAATSRLYRNRGDGTFEDVAEAAGVDLNLYGMGVAVGDVDGDGLADLFVTSVGGNRLLRNFDGARFVDVTETSGVAGARDAWSTGAAFFDMENDGDLDLFVCNYVAWSPDIDRDVDFRLTGVGRAYGPPTDFPGSHSYLYRNDGGTFTDISAEAGIEVANPATGVAVGKALAVHPVDVDGDGLLDLVVANDTVRNFLFLNEGGGRFREAGVAAGLAFDTSGGATGAMGLDTARYDNDDKLAVAIGNFANEMSSFYVSRPGESVFSDDAIVAGIGAPSRRALTFGLFFFDADLDGRIDMLAANGHVEPEIARVQASQSYAQPAQLFWNCAACQRRYAMVETTGDLGTPRVGRGLAYADIDADGDLDVLLTTAGGRAALLRNDQSSGHNWLRLDLGGPAAGTIGGVVTVVAGKSRQRRQVMPARGYLTSVELPLTFGLGAEKSATVQVRWPNGATDSWQALAANRTHRLRPTAGG